MNKTACVTGADRGVGLALAEGLLRQEYRVFAGVYSGGNTETERLQRQYPGRLEVFPLDVSDPESVRSAAGYIQARTDRVDVLINNAAILGDIRNKVSDGLDFDEIEAVFRVNALGPLRMVHALIPLVLHSGMKLIVNISSEAGSIGTCWRDSWYAYCMSKASVNMQSALIHNEIKTKGGQVLVLHPGHVRTYMQGKLDADGKLSPEESAERILKLVARHRDFQAEAPAYLDEEGKPIPW